MKVTDCTPLSLSRGLPGVRFCGFISTYNNTGVVCCSALTAPMCAAIICVSSRQA